MTAAQMSSYTDEVGRLPSWLLLPDADQQELDAISPLALADEFFPPTAIFQGTADNTLPLRSSVCLHTRLVELGVPADLHTYAGRGHEFDVAPCAQEAAVTAAVSFLGRQVVNRERDTYEISRYVFPPGS